MRHLIRLTDWTPADVDDVFALARRYRTCDGPRLDGAVAMFFPPSSIRTRASFERGAASAGLQPIVFPPESLDKPEALEDVAGYLAQFVDAVVVRHPDISVLERLAAAEALPIVNAMTSENHPCEVLSDLFALSLSTDPRSLRYVFVGADGNIGRAWREAAQLLSLEITQCCPAELAMSDVPTTEDLEGAVSRADVILTDGPGKDAEALAPYRITGEVLAKAPAGVRLAPCPPFVRGREVTAEAIASDAFVGYGFKRELLPVQQAILAHCMV
ncbi:MAG TPA: ornithine carbamoyltransferase [Microbacterium sp.]|nr:ornithine carbamoyltransferase [Microbacterium sp.]